MEDLSEVLRKLATRDSSEDNPYRDAEPDREDDGCSRCRGRGWFTADVPVGDPAFGQVVTCGCQGDRVAQERQARLLRYSNLASMKRFTFSTLTPEGRGPDSGVRRRFQAAYEAAVAYADRAEGFLVLVGPHGAGKTHLAAAIGNRLISQGQVVFFSHVPDLLDHLRSSFSPSSEVVYSDLFDQVKAAPLLILDGIGSSNPSPWAQEKLRQVINHRFNMEMPTVVTCTGSLRDVDPYVASRMMAEGHSRVIELGDPAVGRGRLGAIEPEMLRRMTFEKFDVRGNSPNADQRGSLEGAYLAAKSFAAAPDGWLALLGDTGVGKTHLAVAIANEQMKNGRTVFFVLVSDLLDYLRFTYSPESTVTYDRLLDDVKNTPLLLLDDLGREHSTAWAVEKLYQIISHRYNSRLHTIITAVGDFADRKDPVASRVKDPSLCQLIHIDAPDYRDSGRHSPRRHARGPGTGLSSVTPQGGGRQ